MRVVFRIEGVTFLGADKRDYVSKKTGQPGVIYDLSIKQGGQVGQLGTVKEVYDMYADGQIKDFSSVVLDCTYNSDFRNLQVVGIHPSK